MKIKMIVIVMLTLLLMAAGPLTAEEKAKPEVDKAENYRKVILQHAKLDITKFKEQLKGGLADGKAVTDFPLKQLLMAMEANKIHTDNPMLALELAMDHLVKMKDCHTRPGVMNHGRCGMMGKNMHHRGMKMKKGHAGNCCDMQGHKAGADHKCAMAARQAKDARPCAMKDKTAMRKHACCGESGKKGEKHTCAKDKVTAKTKPACESDKADTKLK